jgi:hypothetical protein
MTIALLHLLCDARANDTQVEIVVDECLYACCARPPKLKGGYEQTYRGLVASIDERQLVLHSIALRTLNYHVVVEVDHVLDVTPLEDP